jgi:S-formylglutathione hydrolase FrmB
MAHLTCTFSSECLKMNTSLTIVLPEDREMCRTRVVYLLHGLMDNCTGWTRYTAVERYAREYNAALIIPEVQRSFYTDMEMGLNYFSYVLEEVPALCRRFFGFSEKREYNYIMGLSMGGYGALKCLLTKPERYAGCATFSAVTDMPGRVAAAGEEDRREFQAIFGTACRVPEKSDLFALAKKADAAALPKIYTACGEGDDLYPENVRFAKLLQESGAGNLFEHWEGIHDWIFWDRAVKRGMDVILGEQ